MHRPLQCDADVILQHKGSHKRTSELLLQKSSNSVQEKNSCAMHSPHKFDDLTAERALNLLADFVDWDFPVPEGPSWLVLEAVCWATQKSLKPHLHLQPPHWCYW